MIVVRFLRGGQGCDIALIGLDHGTPEIFDGRVFLKLIAPVRRAGRYGVVLSVVAGSLAGINDRLCERGGCLVVILPECCLGRFIPQGEVRVVLPRFDQQVEQSLHAAAVFLKAFDRHREQCGGSVIGWIAEYIHIEDDIVDGHRLTVREHDVIAQGEIIEDRTVFILRHLDVRRTVIGIISSVVVVGLAFDTLVDDLSYTVCGDQSHLRHRLCVLVIGCLREERGELAGEIAVSDDQHIISAFTHRFCFCLGSGCVRLCLCRVYC